MLVLLSIIDTTLSTSFASAAPIESLSLHKISADYPVPNVIDIAGAFLNGWDNVNSPIVSQVNTDGTISIAVAEEKKDVYIYEFDADYRLQKQIILTRELPLFGSYAKDTEGNYYILFGQGVEENQGDATVALLVKYDSSGRNSKI